MSMFKSLIICSLVALTVQADINQCGANEEFRSCGTACEPACSKPATNFCTMQCIVNVCQCKRGYSRDNSGNCIKTTDCPRRAPPSYDQCPAGEYFNGCGACDSTCENRNMMCAAVCRQGSCACNTGLVRNSAGKCIPVSECPSVPSCKTTVCKSDEVCRLKQVICVRAPCNPIPFCVKKENESQSQCASVSCFTGNQCIVQSNRPICVPNAQNDKDHLSNPCKTHTCKVGEKCVEQQVQCFVAPCYPVAECVTTKYDEDQSPCYTVRCGSNTECKAINGSAQCIPRGKDVVGQEVCPVNQTFVQCSSNCPSKCSDNGNPVICNKACGPPACTCSANYYLTDKLDCVLLKDCPKTNSTINSTLTCATVKCASGTTCTIVNGQPTCTTPGQANTTAVPILTCATMNCMTGFSCETLNGRPFCRPSSSSTSNSTILTTTTSGLTCRTVRCAGGSVCQIVNGGPRCTPSNSTSSNSTILSTTTSGLTCATVKCAGGSVCQIVNGGPRCTPSNFTESPCNMIDCRPGLTCKLVGNEATCVKGNRTELPSQCASMQCLTGFACRKNVNGTVGCVQLNDTSIEPVCPKNEMYKLTNGCEPTCSDPFKTCANSTEGACVCAGGFVRNGKRCVAYSVCPVFSVSIRGDESCANTEVYTKQKRACEVTCRGNELCRALNDTTVEGGCDCRKYYKRNEKGNCVHQRFCYRTAGCKENESWNSCIECESKCNDTTSKCDKLCTSGCGCDDGFSRNDNMTCVPDDSC